MPPQNKAPAETDPNRVRTRAANAKAHPGNIVKDALRARNPPRDPDLIQKEKADKEVKKAAKKKQVEEAQAKEELATQFVKEYRARKDIEERDEEMAMPRQKPKAIAHRTGESAEGTNTTSGGGGGNASNRTVNEGIKNTPIVEEHCARETEELNEGKVMPRPKPKAIAHRTRESAEGTNTTSGGGGMASNRTVNGGSKNTPIVEEYHARETEDLNEGKVMPRPRPKALAHRTVRTREIVEANTTSDSGKALNHTVNGGIKNTPIAVSDTVQVGKMAPKQGTKRRNIHLEREGNESIMALSKKAKLTEAPKLTSARIAPRPVFKGKSPASKEAGETKKRPNPTDDDSDSIASAPENLKTTSPPLKKSRVGKNDPKPQPIRRTETLMYEDESGIKTIKLTNKGKLSNIGVDHVEDEDNAKTPRPRGSHVSREVSDNEEPYVTPVLLSKKKRRVVAPPLDDTELEDSEVERKMREKFKRLSSAATAAKSSSDKTRTRVQLAAHSQPASEYVNSSKIPAGRSVPTSRSSTAIKRTTTNSNNIIITGTSATQAPPKKSKSKRALVSEAPVNHEPTELQDEHEDDSYEEKAALASPVRGSESRKMNKTKVKIERNDSPKGRIPLPVSTVKIFNNDVVPTWQAQVFSTKDYWPNIDDHLDKLQSSWDRYLGKKYPHKIDKDTDAYHKAKAKLCDLRNRMKNRADQVTLDEFRKWVGDDEKAMQDPNKRIAFGKEYCNPKEWKFVWKAFDKEKGIRVEKYKNEMILETFAVYFTFATPANPLPDGPDLKIGHPQGALALATAAIERSLSLYRDDHLEYNKGTISLKTENAEQKTKKTGSNLTTKQKKTLKYDFSFANWGETTERWLKGVKKRYTTLFPEVSKQARVLAGFKIKLAQADIESLSSGSDADSSGRDIDSDYEGFGNVRNVGQGNDSDADEQTGNNTGNRQGGGDDEGDDDDDGHGDDQQEGDDDNVGGHGQQELEGNGSDFTHSRDEGANEEPVTEDNNYEMSDPEESSLSELSGGGETEEWV